MEASGYKLFNDSVHGPITLHPLLVKVIDTPEFQRLRNLKQLGVAYYVFPSSGHCRYEHSLGTCHLAGQMVHKLMSRVNEDSQSRMSEDAKEVARLTLCVEVAALCHDLGHGPFSHTWEHVTKLWPDSENWTHEEASVKMFDYLVKKNKLEGEFESYELGEKHREMIKALIMGKPPKDDPRNNFLYEIVSNKATGIDVDKWDYFLRDGLHLNLPITFDYRRLLEFCTVLTTEDKAGVLTTHIAFRDKEIMTLYDMYRVRSALHFTAYRHKVVINIELMLIDAFKAAGDAGYKINNSETALKDAHKCSESLAEMTDHIFYDILYSRSDILATSRKLLDRILRRDLYKFVDKAYIIIPVKGRKEHIQMKKNDLESQLKEKCPLLEFRVGDFYLDLDSQNDPVSKAVFYTVARGSKQPKWESYDNIRDNMFPFPFQLTKETTAQLLVFCKTTGVTEDKLTEAREIIKSFSSAV